MSEMQIQVPKGWAIANLDEFIQKIEKRNPKEKPNEAFKYIEISSIDNLSKKIIRYKTLLGKNAPSRARNVIKKNDVIYSTTRPYYRDVAIIDDKLDDQICSTGFCVLRAIDPDVLHPNYLYYFLQSDIANNQILQDMKGSSYPAVRNDDVTNISIPLPKNIEVQKKIVQKLDYILRQIEEKRKLILELQKTSEVHKDNFSTSIFPALVWNLIIKYSSGKFEILSDYIKKTNKKNPISEPMKYFKYVEINSEDKSIQTWKTLLGREAPSRARNAIEENDVIFATTRPYYRDVALIPSELNNEICSTGFCVLRTNDKNQLEPRFLYYFLQTDFAINQILIHMRGGSYPAVSDTNVKEIKFPLVDISDQRMIIKKIDDLQKKFNDIKSKIYLTQNIKKNLIDNLNNMQYTVLSQAFLGKLVN